MKRPGSIGGSKLILWKLCILDQSSYRLNSLNSQAAIKSQAARALPQNSDPQRKAFQSPSALAPYLLIQYRPVIADLMHQPVRPILPPPVRQCENINGGIRHAQRRQCLAAIEQDRCIDRCFVLDTSCHTHQRSISSRSSGLSSASSAKDSTTTGSVG